MGRMLRIKLYYFTSQQYALESLRDKRLKIARFSELNDPFDFLGLAVDLPAQRQHLKQMRDRADARYGILCMSTTWQEPLLWAHYADKHKGICLGFEVNAEEWREVHYKAERPALAHYGAVDPSELTGQEFDEINVTKFRAWAYEREYRRFAELRNPDLVTGLHFHPFEETMQLKQVIVGYRSTVTRAAIQCLCEHVGGGIEAFKARPAFRDFKVVRQHQEERWV
jgi:hypothetical protein